MAELAFEFLLAGLEAAGALGNAINPPTRYLNMAGTVTPQRGIYRPAESRGTLAEGGADVYLLPMLLNALVKGGVDGSGAVAATLSTLLDGENNDLKYTAVAAGSMGNAISVQYIDPDAASHPLEVDVVGQAIRVWLATDVDKLITTIASAIETEIEAHPVAKMMVTVANVSDPANDGSGVVTAMAASHLTGGVGTNITTPEGAVDSRLWTFEPTMDADDLRALTLYWGDPNVQAFQAAYCQIDTLTLAADASGEEGVTQAISGMGKFPSKTPPASVPGMLSAPLLAPGDMQLWIDSGAAPIGDSPITGRVVSAEVTIPSGVVRKWLAQGPGSDLAFTKHRRGKRHVEARLVLELEDMDQYDLVMGHTPLKTRIRFNGPKIETEAQTDFYHYVEVDIYGPADAMEWGENQGTNRTIQMTILSEYDDDAGHDFAVRVQSDRDSL